MSQFNLRIVQRPVELFSSQWKPPSTLLKTHTLKSIHFGKGPALGSKLGPLFRGLVYPKYSKLEVKDPILDHFHTIIQNVWASNLCFQDKQLFLVLRTYNYVRRMHNYLVVCTPIISNCLRKGRLQFRSYMNWITYKA